ncbi:MAG: recombination mediator RecR [Bacteriovoracales bacterium]|nr:recombination mediator RecR [Bacteriovoracales bacterium]
MSSLQLPQSLERIKESLAKFSGVGEKSAMRMTLQLVNWPSEERKRFSDSLEELSHLKQCRECFVYSHNDLCTICADSKRVESKLICVVENVSDLLAIERCDQYRGIYHVLGGVLNPLLGIGPENLEIHSLINRVKKLHIENVILAINPSVEGDATCSYLNGLFEAPTVVERIGFGLPMGGSLEYVDAMTISKALENRRNF